MDLMGNMSSMVIICLTYCSVATKVDCLMHLDARRSFVIGEHASFVIAPFKTVNVDAWTADRLRSADECRVTVWPNPMLPGQTCSTCDRLS